LDFHINLGLVLFHLSQKRVTLIKEAFGLATAIRQSFEAGAKERI
jgi:hypothetical protein